MSKERNIHDTSCNEDSCDVTAFKEIDVCVPITVEPYIDLGEPIIECIEEPCLVPIPCAAWNKKNGKCRFTICQKLSIMIPIEFKAEALSGPPSVNCSAGGEEEEEDEEDEEECPPYIFCGQGEGLPLQEKILDFYYFVRGRRGRLKK
jgi:hypothetical protein